MELNKSWISLNSCRICMTSCDPVRSYINIFNTKLDYKQEQINCYNMIQDITQVTLFETDGLPVNICTQCITDLQVAYSFKRLFESSYQSFHKILEKPVKEEKCFDTYSEVCFYDIETDYSEDIDEVKDANIEIHENGVKFYCKICKKYYKNEYIHMEKHLTVSLITINDPCQITTTLKKEETIQNKEGQNKAKTKRKPARPRTPKNKVQKSFFCNICQNMFLKAEHKRIHTAEEFREMFKCEVCGKGYLDERFLKIHIAKHHPDVRIKIKCQDCGKLVSKANLNKHKILHSGVKKFICEFCAKDFFFSDLLANHLLYHSEERNHECKKCGIKFKSPNSLREHLLRHSGVKKFKCDICQNSYFRRIELRRHMLTHTKERKYKCQVCSSMFSRRDNRNVHERSVHGLNVNTVDHKLSGLFGTNCKS